MVQGSPPAPGEKMLLPCGNRRGVQQRHVGDEGQVEDPVQIGIAGQCALRPQPDVIDRRPCRTVSLMRQKGRVPEPHASRKDWSCATQARMAGESAGIPQQNPAGRLPGSSGSGTTRHLCAWCSKPLFLPSGTRPRARRSAHTMLDRHHAANREAGAVGASGSDLVEDRHLGIARPEKIGMKRNGRPARQAISYASRPPAPGLQAPDRRTHAARVRAATARERRSPRSSSRRSSKQRQEPGKRRIRHFHPFPTPRNSTSY